MFEVRTEHVDSSGNSAGYIVETRRTSEKDAQQDVELLKLFGKKAWITEIES